MSDKRSSISVDKRQSILWIKNNYDDWMCNEISSATPLSLLYDRSFLAFALQSTSLVEHTSKAMIRSINATPPLTTHC